MVRILLYFLIFLEDDDVCRFRLRTLYAFRLERDAVSYDDYLYLVILLVASVPEPCMHSDCERDAVSYEDYLYLVICLLMFTPPIYSQNSCIVNKTYECVPFFH
ncbi:hypothetical protein KP509_08G069400 [Ceratopteris richardii]|uniref:Uncharacterized protein n=1 Tax=Ceratopteris richardii TaxID=49495 RepID=A0A8T2UBF9_CERRI|nr:hypothetical protein KP509_08G069400 [Ceratopteris richardii]